jgi:AcrR family transcriptional regulator
VQESVHNAVHELQTEVSRAALTVPMIATRAGVTPSTIYRRWGDLSELLADVSSQRLRPDSDPADHGQLRADLTQWLDQFVDEMASELGLAMVRDVLGSSTMGKVPCCTYTREAVSIIAERAIQRGEATPSVDTLMDHVVAPIMYRIIFGGETISTTYAHRLVDVCLTNLETLTPG